MAIREKSKEKLGRVVEEEVTRMFESVLDYAQVACPTPETYKVLRSKILRVGNNCIRVIKKKLDHYDIEYNATTEDIVEVQRR